MVPRRETQLPGMFFRFCSAFPGKSIERGRAEPRGPRFFFSSIRIGRNPWGGRLIIEKFQKLINNCARIIVSTSLGSTHFSRLCDCACCGTTHRVESTRSVVHLDDSPQPSFKTFLEKKVFCGVPSMTHPPDSSPRFRRFDESLSQPRTALEILSRNIVYWDIGKFSVNFLFFLLF